MSELINNPSDRLTHLLAFARGMVKGENGHQLVLRYKAWTDSVTPFEAMVVLDVLLKEGVPAETVKAYVPKIINVFYKSLKDFTWEKPAAGHFMHYLMEENRAVERIMDEIKTISKAYFATEDGDTRRQLRQKIEELKTYELHYIKKENILFSYIERAFPDYRCLAIMWSFHDDFRRSLKILDNILASEQVDRKVFSNELGKLFFVVLPIIFREEQIVFPVAMRAIPPHQWNEMLEESHETGWCYITPPSSPTTKKATADKAAAYGRIDLETGILLPEQIKWILNTIPVDVTFIDENDEVKYFSGGKHRIFNRSKAIIGRKVQNCHPPESVHVVEEIVNAFKEGSRDNADFWITLKGRFLHIRYFAVRSEAGQYQGTLEVSQDVTEIRALEGERRLLEWK